MVRWLLLVGPTELHSGTAHKPAVKSVVDTTNFDDYPADPEGPPPDDVTGWDKDF